MNSRLKIIVSGLIAQYPMGGVTWDYIQYVLGLARLGHQVYYLEDTGTWPFNPQSNGLDKSGCQYNVDYLASVMQRFGLADNWLYRMDYTDTWYGLSDPERNELLKTADLLINVSGCLGNPEVYRSVGKMAYIDSDPVFTQLRLLNPDSATRLRQQVQSHDVLFSFADNPPTTGDVWHHTRQPIAMDQWDPVNDRRPVFTTVMNWTSYESISYRGVSYGQKDEEFEHFIDLPADLPENTLELALAERIKANSPRQRLIENGWALVCPNQACGDIDSYRNYVQTSFAEWSVAKNGYVKANSGWFSCRSACYLASARPVVVQDTGFGRQFSIDSGIAAFRTREQALHAIEQFRANPDRYSAAAHDTASTWFNSDIVLSDLIDVAMNTHTLETVNAA